MRTLACLLLAALSLSGCGKKKSGTAAATVPVVVQPTLLTEGPQLGLAARVPSDVEFCLSSVHLRQHVDALTAAHWWQGMKTYLDDKMPATSGTPVKVDEAFIAFGKGSSKEIAVLRQLNDLYNETAYRGFMSGGSLAGMGTSFDIARLVNVALADSQVLDSLILLLERFEMPTVTVGMASPEPEKVLQKISSHLHLSTWMGDAPQSRIVTTQGEQITVNEIAMSSILTVARRREWMEFLTKSVPQITPETRDRLARGLDVLAGKNWVLALGLSKDRAYLTVAQHKAQVRLANSVEDSILARPELRFADGQAQRPGLGLIACWDGAFFDVMQSNEPFLPLVRGLITGLKSEKMFAGVARTLEPLVQELGSAERAFYRNEHTSGAAVAWWENGLRIAWEGGMNASSIPTFSKPSRFTSLLDEPSVVVGISGQGTGSGTGRAYFEAWMKLLHATADQLILTGVGGEQAATTFKLADTLILPGIIELYNGTKTIWQKGLGNDGAAILDIGGKMPSLPGLPPGGESVPLPRFAVVQEMRNRSLLDVSWQNMETALQLLAKNIPTEKPLELPEVLTQRKGPITTHAIAIPLQSADLTPCVSLTDQLFLVGTSRLQQHQMAETLARSDTSLSVGRRTKVNFIKLREFLKPFIAARGPAGDVELFKQTLKYVEPLDVLDVRVWGDNGVARGTLTCGMHDILSYD